MLVRGASLNPRPGRRSGSPTESRRTNHEAQADDPYNSATMNHSQTQSLRLAVAAAVASVIFAGCGLFSSTPAPTAAPKGSSTTTISEETATPAPTPQIVRSVLLVAQVGEPQDWTPAGLAWRGIKTAAAKIGATTTLIEPTSNTDFAADLDRAAGPAAAVVVTLGPDAAAAVLVAAKAHPATQFLELDVAVPDTAPANVHGLNFDEAEAGYLAGYVAASIATAGQIGMVGDTAADVASANYAAGLKAGAAQAGSSAEVTIAYAGTADSPAKGRTAAGVLAKAGGRVVAAMPSLSGIGALRQACGAGLQLVGLDIDLWQNVPDVQSCVIASVLKRYDVAAASAISTIASGKTLPRLSTGSVGSGSVALSDFHVDLPAGFKAKLDAVVGALSNRPAPSTAPAAGSPSASPGA